jgi:uncharacterized protein (DUF302 family)
MFSKGVEFMRNVEYGFYKELPGKNIEQAEEIATRALKEEGFGILTRIDVQSTLKNKIDVDFKPYVILGACNPGMAHQALELDDSIGLLLPCNVVVAETENGAEVGVVKASAMFEIVKNPKVAPVAETVNQMLSKAFESM